MSRFWSKYEEFRNVNIQADLVVEQGKPAVLLAVTADAPTPTGMKRFFSKQHVDLSHFFDSLRAENPPSTQPEPARADVLDLSTEEARA